MYRAWVALRDAESGKEAGVQGFLKLSVTVLGPGDRQRVHDLAEEIQVEPHSICMGRSRPELSHILVFGCKPRECKGLSEVGLRRFVHDFTPVPILAILLCFLPCMAVPSPNSLFLLPASLMLLRNNSSRLGTK